MPLSEGDQFGPYEILTPIGAGGMGEVYKAREYAAGPHHSAEGFQDGVQSAVQPRSTRGGGTQSSQHLHALRCRSKLSRHGVRRGKGVKRPSTTC